MEIEYIHKAKQNLTAAQICYDSGLYDACANRAYYAAFQAAIAILSDKGIKREKVDHKWVQAEFSRLLIKREKLFPSKFRSYLSRIQIVRNCADYSDENVRQKEALRQLNKANEIVRLIMKELKI